MDYRKMLNHEKCASFRAKSKSEMIDKAPHIAKLLLEQIAATYVNSIQILIPLVAILPNIISAQEFPNGLMFDCQQSRICYDTLPCAGVENPEVDFCSDRPTCDISENLGFQLEFRENEAIVYWALGGTSHYSVLSRYENEFSSQNITHYTLFAPPDTQEKIVRHFIYLEMVTSASALTAEIVTADLALGPDRATTTTYGRCIPTEK